MSVTRSVVTAAIFAVISQSAVAQSVMSEPGYCAQYYPNANCQDTGPGSPCVGPAPRNLAYAAIGQSVGVTGRKPRHQRSAMSPQ